MSTIDFDLMKRLIAFDTTSSKSNLAMADFVCEYCETHGGRLHRCFSADGSKVNVLALKGPESADGQGLTLCGHMDVVPATEPQWKSDPFELVRTDDRLVARGACDMKGSVAIAMQLFAETDAATLRAPLALLLTYDEEVGSLGVKRFLEDGLADRGIPRSIIIGEPTSVCAVRMHKGHLKLRINVQGRSGHSGSPHLGVNAISAASQVTTAIDALAAQLVEEPSAVRQFFSEVPYVILAPVRIHGGEAMNVIPEACFIDLSVRLLPGMDSEPFIARVKAAAESVIEWRGSVHIETLDDNPPMFVEDGIPLNQTLTETLGQSETIGVSFASDGGRLAQAGYDCVLFGPGSIEVAHRPNEYVPIVELDRVCRVLHTMIRRLCMDG